VPRSGKFAASGKVSDLLVGPGVLGRGWRRVDVLVLDDVRQEPQGLTTHQRRAFESLMRLHRDDGLRGHADLIYERGGRPDADARRQRVIVSIEVFDDEALAGAFWEKRYGADGDGWFPVEWKGGSAAADGTEVGHAFLCRDVVVSAGQLYDGPEKRKVLNRYLKALGSPPAPKDPALNRGREGPKG
jgi:hypothetical protein